VAGSGRKMRQIPVSVVITLPVLIIECPTTMQILKFKKPAHFLPTQTEYAFTNMNGNI
jgi:hypothetical protein